MAETDADANRLLEARNISVEIGGSVLLRDVNLTVDPAESWAIVGGSHSGKSVFLKVLAGLMKPTRGIVLLSGKPVRTYDNLSVPWEEGMGYVSQNLGLRSNMTALENTSLPLLYHGTLPADRASEKAAALLARLGVKDTASRPATLTPGERSLVALARALVFDPKVLLLDNPVVVLDVDYAENVLELLRERRQQGLAVVVACSSESVASLLSENARRLRDGTMEELQ